MIAQILLRVVPFTLCVFVAFFGHLIAHVVRAFAVFWSATAPALMPAITPYLATGESDMTPDTLMMVVGAVFAGGLACFVSVKNRNFGMRVQSMSVGFFAINAGTPAITVSQPLLHIDVRSCIADRMLLAGISENGISDAGNQK